MTLKNARTGTIVATCLSGEGGVPKHPQSEVEVYVHGVRGDFHAGKTRVKKGETIPNERMISVMSKDVLDEVGGRLGVELKAGAVGENFLVSGLGDLADLEEGDLIKLGPTVGVLVSMQNTPCSMLNVHHPEMLKSLVGKRGIVGTVLYVGFVKPGDRVEIVKKSR